VHTVQEGQERPRGKSYYFYSKKTPVNRKGKRGRGGRWGSFLKDFPPTDKNKGNGTRKEWGRVSQERRGKKIAGKESGNKDEATGKAWAHRATMERRNCECPRKAGESIKKQWAGVLPQEKSEGLEKVKGGGKRFDEIPESETWNRRPTLFS